MKRDAHITLLFHSSKDKENILQLFRKKTGHVQRIMIHNDNRLLKAMLEARKQWKTAFKILRKHHHLPSRIPYSEG